MIVISVVTKLAELVGKKNSKGTIKKLNRCLKGVQQENIKQEPINKIIPNKSIIFYKKL